MARFSVGEEEQQEVEVCNKKRKLQSRGGKKTINTIRKMLQKNVEEELYDREDDEEVAEEEEEQDDREEYDEEGEEMEGGGGGEKEDDEVEGGEVGESSGSGHENSVSVRIDLDLLDCSICFEPLHSPIFQCKLGHVSCSSCCPKLLNKCHICSNTIGHSRCLALEKVIESIKIGCSHAVYGCKRSLSCSQRRAHEETCIHAPSQCPLKDCMFRGSTEMLMPHLDTEHGHTARSFRYGKTFRVVLVQTDPYIFFCGESDRLFLLVNNGDLPLGRTLSVACVRPSNRDCDFTYKLTAHGGGGDLQLKAQTANINNLIGYHPPVVFLMVPVTFCKSGKIVLDVCIQKI